MKKQILTALIATVLLASPSFAAGVGHFYMPRGAFQTTSAGSGCTGSTTAGSGSGVPKPVINCQAGNTSAFFVGEFWMPHSNTGNTISLTTTAQSQDSNSTHKWCNIVSYTVAPQGADWDAVSGNEGGAILATANFNGIVANGSDMKISNASVVAYNALTAANCVSTACQDSHGLLRIRRGVAGTDAGCTGVEMTGDVSYEGVDVSWPTN